MAPPGMFHDSSDGADLSAILHEEIGRLPVLFRTAVVLCDLEGRTHEEAAQLLGWPVGTVKSRQARARARLRDRLIRRGLAPSVGLWGAFSAPEAVAAPLLRSTTRAALEYLSGSLSTGVVSASVIALTSQFSRRLLMNRVKVATLLCFAVGVGTAGVQVFARQKPGDPPAVAKTESAKTATVPWRYQLVRLIYESQLAEKANEEAAKGWEVVEVVPIIHGINGNINTQYTILFRRPADAKD